MAFTSSCLSVPGSVAAGEGDPPSATDLFAALPISTLLIDPQGRVADANPAAEALLNIARGALLGTPLSSLLEFAGRDDLADKINEDHQLSIFDITISNGRGLRILADITLSPISEKRGWRIFSVYPGTLNPPRSRRDQGSGFRAAIGAAALLAHEIKNPLSGISGAAQLLERKVSPEGRSMTQLIRSEVDRIVSLIDRMEDFTDPRPLTLQTANIYPVLDHALALASHGFARNIAIETAFDPSLPQALVHEGALGQIMLNLLKNAAEAVAEMPDPLIRITTAYRHGVSTPWRAGEERRLLPIEICVIDNGPGPPPEIIDHLFEAFVSSKQSGGGLGLALVDKLVRDVGGIIQFAREGEPERTVFRLLLQRAGKGI